MKALTRTLLIGLASLAWSLPEAQAQSMTVKKVKGRQAIVDIQGLQVRPGETYDLGGNEVSDDVLTPQLSKGSRSRFIEIDLSLLSLSTETSGSSSTTSGTSISGVYGWNTGKLEYGFSGEFGLSNTSAGSTTTFGFGGVVDWNLEANRPGRDSLFGFGADLKYKISNPPSPAKSTNTLLIYPTVFWKWFALGNSTALKIDFGYWYESRDQSGSSTKLQGLVAVGAFAVYF